jgi:hypothetical protein
LKKEEFMQQIEGCKLPDTFDQHLLDNASDMFGKWGTSTHMDEKEHLFEGSGLVSKPGDSDALKKEKRHCVVCARR